jgi:hypothetical protein
MLRITVDLVPGGFEPLSRKIATMQIANLSDLADLSDYAIEATEGPNPLTKTGARRAHGNVLAHERRQSVWALIAKAADEIRQADFSDL